MKYSLAGSFKFLYIVGAFISFIMVSPSNAWKIGSVFGVLLLLIYFGQATIYGLLFPQIPTQEGGYYHVLVLGHGQQDLTAVDNDTISVVSVHPEKRVAALFHLGRDLMIDGARLRTINKDDLRRQIEDLFSIELVGVVELKKDAIVHLIDALDGVAISVDQDLDDPQYPSDDGGWQPIFIPAGEHVMGGELAYMYGRSRKSTSELSRLYRQTHLIEALSRVLSSRHMSALSVSSLVRSIDDAVVSDLSWRQRIRIANDGASLKKGCLQPKVLHLETIEGAFEEAEDSLSSGPSFVLQDDFSAETYMKQQLTTTMRCRGVQ